MNFSKINETDIEVPSEIKIPNRVNFSSNKTFQTHNVLFEQDIAFFKEQKNKKNSSRSWASSAKYYIDERQNREIITTMLAAQDVNSFNCAEKLLEQNINYRDLASLNDKDLQLLGYKSTEQRDELLKFFAKLPNQDPNYENICKLPDAQKYNDQILENASEHMDVMRSALALSNYKLKLLPPEDVIVGEKSFASRFVLAALNELKSVTDEIDDELHDISEMVTDFKVDDNNRKRAADADNGNNYLLLSYYIILSSLATGAFAALWFWKLNKYFK